jgi:hypothetical protein
VLFIQYIFVNYGWLVDWHVKIEQLSVRSARCQIRSKRHVRGALLPFTDLAERPQKTALLNGLHA